MKKSITLPLGSVLTGILLFTSTACDKFEQTICHPGNNKVSIFATGLNNPRGLKFGPDGNLYVAEAGIGGKTSTVGQCEQVSAPIGPYTGSPTGGRISRINKAGVRTTVTDKLPSSQAQELIGGDVQGVADVAFIGNTLYALIAGAGCSHGVSSAPNGVYKIDATGASTVVANTGAYLLANPVKAPHFGGGFEPEGTPYSMINVGGDFYVIEPNQDQLLKVTTSGAISRVSDITASQGHVVPTVVAYHDGNFYFGNLNVFPIADGSSNIYKVTPSGEVSVWAKGFTTVLGIAFDDEGQLYVLENTTGNPFPTLGTGKIIRVGTSGNRETIASGLSLPTGMTLGPDGMLYVSHLGFSPASIGGGQILQVDIRECTNSSIPFTVKTP